MKKKLILFVFGLSMMMPTTLNANVISYFNIATISNIGNDDEIPDMPAHPHRTPANKPVTGYYNGNEGTLSLTVKDCLQIYSVEIYKDGVLLICDLDIFNYELEYNVQDTGFYEIRINTSDDITYQSYLSI